MKNSAIQKLSVITIPLKITIVLVNRKMMSQSGESNLGPSAYQPRGWVPRVQKLSVPPWWGPRAIKGSLFLST